MAARTKEESTVDKYTPLTNADLNPDDIVRLKGKEWRVQGIDDGATIGLLLLAVAEPKVSPDFVDTAFPITRGSGRRPENGSDHRWCWAFAEDVELVSRGKPE